MLFDEIKQLVAEDLEAVNHLILNKIKSEHGLAERLGHYILGSGGKRIRPLLTLLSAHACGYTNGNLHHIVAAVVEFIHTATLLHDDVVDEASLRRGKKTANYMWGNQASILVGDFLFTHSTLLLLEHPHPKIQKLLAHTAYEISRGELKQLSNRYNTALSVQDYLEIIRSKTALLFAASSAAGPLLTNGPEHLETAFYTYGLHLGNTFQLIDDTLDYCADPDITGKNNGGDLADGKATMPLLHVLQHGTDLQKQLVKDSLEAGSCTHFSEILNAIEATGAIEYTRCAANREKELAIQALKEVPDSPYKQALIDVAGFAWERNY